MFFPEERIKIFVYTKPTDMRKSFKGLISLTQNVLAQDSLSGHLFMFVNRRGNYTKILYFDRTGYCIWSKKLAQGTFHFNPATSDIQVLNVTALKLILEGVSIEKTRQFKRFQRKNKSELP